MPNVQQSVIDARSGGGQFTRVSSGKIEQVKLKISNVKTVQPFSRRLCFYSKISNIKPWIWRQLLLSCGYKTLTLLISLQICCRTINCKSGYSLQLDCSCRRRNSYISSINYQHEYLIINY